MDSIEALLEECMPLAVGRNPHAFNSHAFKKRLDAIEPIFYKEEAIADEQENIEYMRRSLVAAAA